MKRDSKPKEKNIELLSKFLKNKDKNYGNTNWKENTRHIRWPIKDV